MRGVETEAWADERQATGHVNQPGSVGSYMLIAELVNALRTKSPVALPSSLPYALYALGVLAVLALTVFAARRRLPATNPDDRAMLIMISCLVYLIILPRVLVYSYTLAVLPAYVTARRYPKVDPVVVLLALMLIVPVVGRPAGINWFINNFAGFTPLFLATALWAAALYSLSPNMTRRFPNWSESTNLWWAHAPSALEKEALQQGLTLTRQKAQR